MRQGEVIGGRYELERRVGVGGMGEVYRARDLTSGEVVAVKVLLGKLGAASGAARFAAALAGARVARRARRGAGVAPISAVS